MKSLTKQQREEFIGFLQVRFTCSQKPTHRYHTSAHNKQDTYLSPDCPKDHTTPTKSATHITSISTTLEWTPVRPPCSSERELQNFCIDHCWILFEFCARSHHLWKWINCYAIQVRIPTAQAIIHLSPWFNGCKYLHYVVLQKCPILKSSEMWKQLEWHN